MSDCPKGHGPKEPGKRCKVCLKEQHRRHAEATRARSAAGTHCAKGHPYREGSWRWVTLGPEKRIRDCNLCRAIANRCLARRNSAGPVASFSGIARHSRKRTYPGKVNLGRVSMRDRITEIHQQILDACDRMDLMSAAELAEWKARRAELVREADDLHVQLDARNASTNRSKRSAKAQPVA